MDATVRVKTKIDTGRLKNRYRAGRDKSLDRIGANMRRQAKREFLNRKPKAKPTWRRIGEKDGTPILEVSFKQPTANRVTSWKTARSPGGFLKEAVEYRRDDRAGSVVIGPMPRATWLNVIQEKGGSAPVQWRMLTKKPADRLKGGIEVPAGMGRGGTSGGRDSRGRFLKGSGGVAYIVGKVDPAHTRKRGAVMQTGSQRVKPGRYMGNALTKQRAKIPQQFRNRISGP
jgi:hypothetical protein